ncbi:HIRAN domain-containing protein [Novosphingobium aromaticivorans]|uniref:HIRAN domain-containing protein n=1 Tax=Novosphingobium aromaticivorans TaxID=48935 RepID=UPI00003C801C|nr:HIRAN domain-containing protein [Novosphingobium aromaticivorans]SCY89289.1 HIRAN domain-containing protein [Novosphingobium aromaticivorans]
MPLPQHTLPIVGIIYPNKRGPTRRFEIQICAPGEPLELRPEPTNPADPSAVAVYSCRGVQIGYVPAERCARIASLIGQGREVTAVFQGADQNRAFMRIAYDGEQPTFPEQRPQVSADSDPDFWPDPTWDE